MNVTEDKSCGNYIHAIVKLILVKNLQLLKEWCKSNSLENLQAANMYCRTSIRECNIFSELMEESICKIGYQDAPAYFQDETTFVHHISLFTLSTLVDFPEAIYLFLRKGLQPYFKDVITAIAMLGQRCTDAILSAFQPGYINKRTFTFDGITPFSYLLERYEHCDQVWEEQDHGTLKMIFHLVMRHKGDLSRTVGPGYPAVTYLLLISRYLDMRGIILCEDLQMSNLLKNTKVDLNQKDCFGRTPFDLFLSHRYMNAEKIILLIEFGFDLHQNSKFSK